jgi:AraC-like DNA-binding protein
MVLLFRTGAGVLLRRGRELAVGPGDAVMLSNGDVGGFTFASAARVAALTLPRAALKPLLRDADAALMRPLPNDSDTLRLLQNYLAVIADDKALASPDLCSAVVAHVHDLVALALGAKRDAAGQAGERGVPAARLRAIKADIFDSLDRGRDISVGPLAARHRITPRYVQMLFESEGTTFTQFVLGQRLARAHRMLVNPNLPDRAITSVAFAAGFGDLSYFIRAFRRAYGTTPSEVRDGIDQI